MAEPLERLTAALADRYRIERELGAGGMARVFVATEPAIAAATRCDATARRVGRNAIEIQNVSIAPTHT